MASIILPASLCPFSETRVFHGLGLNFANRSRVVLMAQFRGRTYGTNPPKHLRYPRRPKLPPEFGNDRFWKEKPLTEQPTSQTHLTRNEASDSDDDNHVVASCDDTATDDEDDDYEEEYEQYEEREGGDNINWEPDEIEAISSLFRGRIPQKPGKLNRERPLPLPLPHKIRPLGFPTPKKHRRMASSTANSSHKSLSNQVYKNPTFLVELAKEIGRLPLEEDVSTILNKWSRFLRKGSLSLTIRELGRMDLPNRALQTFSWAQNHVHLFPDDRILASTAEVLARNRELKLKNLQKFASLASRSVIEAMVRGFIKGGSLGLAFKLILVAKDSKRMLDSSIYAKLILELGKNPDKHMMVSTLLEDLGERDDLNLNQQDCTAIMKVCIRLGKFEVVETLFHWFKQSGHDPSVVMYTTLIHSRYSEEKYRDALAVVWEMEGSNCLFDLPAYRVVIKLFVALNDLSRAVRYFSKLKEAGFFPTYDIYRDLFTIYMVSGRVAKFKDICKEAEMAGFVLDTKTRSQLLQLQN
ncbi:pentatricopeptide repeat-containing protein At2g01860 [Actinidia eriantha]|uniref:pentatricopeptide repeat-containing protein At2g01860 n=1 Tax=Actinidia eriantha TaxID=165200 RepID=UPI0025897683|nr:pentatricopeptide repeat-containing protein At2g01860 [Actinidia eriantha]